jgi:hypothetical protein
MLLPLLLSAALPPRLATAATPAPAGERVAEQEVKVDVAPPEVRTRTFDPKNPPSDMPPLKPGEAAVTQSNFSAQALIGALVVDQTPGDKQCAATVRVNSVSLTARLEITIWLPQGGATKLTAHEDGHRRIDEQFYAGAEKVARELSERMLTREFKGTAGVCDEAVQAAIQKAGNELCGQYMDAVQRPAARAQEIYDELTDHGRNKLGEDAAIRQAVEQEKRERDGKRAGRAAEARMSGPERPVNNE